MFKKVLVLISFILLLGLIPPTGAEAQVAFGGRPAARPGAVPNQVLVNFNDGAGTSDIAKFYAEHGLVEKDRLGFGPEESPRLRLAEVKPPGTLDDPDSFVRTLEGDSRVDYAGLNYLLSFSGPPDDPQWSQLWGLNNSGQTGGTGDADIDAPEAWNVTTGSSDVIVGIIDTGVAYDHPDLAANIWTNPGESGNKSNNGVDDDGNGYIDDVHGINAITGSGDPRDDHGHGTHVAGTIGARGDNGVGVVGVNWNVRIVACKFLDANGGGNVADAVKCFQYFNYLKQVQGQNILVTNNSWGGGGFSQAIMDAMAGLDQPGMAPILHAVAAGNSNNDNDAGPTYPASYDLDNIVAVAATDHNDRYASFSSYGATSVDLAAPGVDILSSVPSGGCGMCDPSGYRTASGTSMATPHVAGAAALVWAQYPGLSAPQVKQRLLWGGDYIGGLEGNTSKSTLTNRRLNVFSSLDNDTSAPASVTDLAVSGSGVISVTLTWTATGDDGTTGTASSYDVRYSPTSSLDWDTATQAEAGPPPQPAGSAESFTVSGLDPSTSYYFAVKVKDNVGNESRISGVVGAGTVVTTVVFQDDMESGTESWTATGLWNQDTFRSVSPSHVWYYGQPTSRNYDTGDRNYGYLTLPAIDLSSASEAIIRFQEWSEVEPSTTYDRTRVQASIDGTNWETVFESHGTNSAWEQRTVELTPYVGGDVYIRFWFYTFDTIYNNYEGWYVDDVQVLVAMLPSSPPPADTTPPAPPIGLSANAGDGQVVLDWADNTEPDLAGYNVQRATTSSLGPYSVVAAQVVASEYTDTGLSNGTTYYYTVTAVDGDGNQSSDSDEASGTPEAEAEPTPEPPPEPTPTPEPTPEPPPPGSANDMYVWDIVFESRTKGKGGKSHDERVVVVVRRDSDADGVAEAGDELVSLASISVTVTGPDVNQPFAGTTGKGKKNQGIYSTDWMGNLANGTYTAEVTSLTHDSFSWDGSLDTLPGQQHTIQH